MKNNNHLLKVHQVADDEIDLLKLVHEVLDGKWLIIFFALISFSMAYIYAHGLSSFYKADALIRIESQKSTIPTVEELVGSFRNENDVGTEMEMLKSRKVLGIAVDDLKLDILSQPKKVRHFSNLYKRFFALLKPRSLHHFGRVLTFGQTSTLGVMNKLL